MSGIAMFGLKYPSLLQFDQDTRNNERVQHNLKSLYQVERAPSDTQFRSRLDLIDHKPLQKGIPIFDRQSTFHVIKNFIY